MPRFYSISTFRNSLSLLLKKEKDGYQSCALDICITFANSSINDIWEMYYLHTAGNARIHKIRIQNSHQNLSRSGGFRLTFLCNRVDQSVCFFNVYPKRGPAALISQSQDEYKAQLKQYKVERNQLVEHNINNELAEI